MDGTGMRHRPTIARRDSVAICFIVWITVTGRLAAQEDRLVLLESSRHALAANTVVLGGALSRPGRQEPVLEQRHRLDRLTRSVSHTAHLPGDDPCSDWRWPSSVVGRRRVRPRSRSSMVEWKGEVGPRLLRFSNGQCRAELWNALGPGRPATRASGRWVFVDAVHPGSPTGVPTIRVSLLLVDGHSVKPIAVELKASWSDSTAVGLSGTLNRIIVASRFFPFSWTATP